MGPVDQPIPAKKQEFYVQKDGLLAIGEKRFRVRAGEDVIQDEQLLQKMAALLNKSISDMSQILGESHPISDEQKETMQKPPIEWLKVTITKAGIEIKRGGGRESIVVEDTYAEQFSSIERDYIRSNMVGAPEVVSKAGKKTGGTTFMSIPGSNLENAKEAVAKIIYPKDSTKWGQLFDSKLNLKPHIEELHLSEEMRKEIRETIKNLETEHGRLKTEEDQALLKKKEAEKGKKRGEGELEANRLARSSMKKGVAAWLDILDARSDAEKATIVRGTCEAKLAMLRQILRLDETYLEKRKKIHLT